MNANKRTSTAKIPGFTYAHNRPDVFLQLNKIDKILRIYYFKVSGIQLTNINSCPARFSLENLDLNFSFLVWFGESLFIGFLKEDLFIFSK